jgi:hypothetical protein
MLIKFLVQIVHSHNYLIVLNRKIDQLIDSDLFHGALLICEIDIFGRMVELLDINGTVGERTCHCLSGDIFAVYIRRD